MGYTAHDLTPERIGQLRNLALIQKVDGILLQEWELVALCDLADSATELRQALLELADAVGQHTDSMTAEGSLHAPLLKASDVALKACPPPPELLNPTVVPMED